MLILKYYSNVQASFVRGIVEYKSSDDLAKCCDDNCLNNEYNFEPTIGIYY